MHKALRSRGLKFTSQLQRFAKILPRVEGHRGAGEIQDMFRMRGLPFRMELSPYLRPKWLDVFRRRYDGGKDVVVRAVTNMAKEVG